MKSHRLIQVILALHAVALVLLFAAVAPTALQAQTVVTDPVTITTPATPDEATAAVLSVVNAVSSVLPAKFAGWLVALGSVVGILRLVFKPLMSAIEAIVKATPSKADDEFVAKAQHSPAYKAFTWFLDLFGSVKIGPQFTAKPSAPPLES